jgi:AraC-like DNA-binding protein
VHGPGDRTSPTAAGWTIVHIEPTALEDELAGMVGPLDEALRFQPGLDLSRAPVRRWVDLARLVASDLDAGPALFDHPLLAPHVERVLMRALLLGQPNTYTGRLLDDRRANRPAHLEAAMRLLEDRPQLAVTTAGLAREVGTSTRALQEGFRQHLGITPMQFLRDARLHRVRLDLLAADTDAGATVSAIAFRWGFTHMGRFASYYRARYGESPSQTLRAVQASTSAGPHRPDERHRAG